MESHFDKFIFPAGFGESLMNPRFFDMIGYAKKKGCRIMMPTNGTLINKDNIKLLRMLDVVQFSIDSMKDIERRTTDPNHIMNLMPILESYGITPFLNVTLGTSNWDEIEDFIIMGLLTKTTINFITPRPLDPSDEYLMDEMRFVASHAEELEDLIRPFPNIFYDDSCRTFQKCKVLNYDFAVAWNGDLYPCSAAFFQDFQFGNVRDYDSFDDFWNTYLMSERVNKGKHAVCNYCKKYDEAWNKSYKEAHEKRIQGILALKDRYIGRPCFLLGTGRSITQELLESLKNEVTIGVNGIVHAKRMWGFEPTFLVLSDHNNFTNRDDFEAIVDVQSEAILSDFIKYHALGIHSSKYSDEEQNYIGKRISIRWLNPFFSIRFWINHKDDISFDLSKGTSICGNVIQDLGIPLAVWLGCKEIYLVGCDCNDLGHFYSPIDEKWRTNNPSLYQYKFFKEKLDEIDVGIYNLSPSKIPAIENRTLEEVLNRNE